MAEILQPTPAVISPHKASFKLIPLSYPSTTSSPPIQSLSSLLPSLIVLLLHPQPANPHSQYLNRKEQHTYNDTLNCKVHVETGFKISESIIS